MIRILIQNRDFSAPSGNPIVNPRLPASLLFASVVTAWPAAHAADDLTLPEMQIQDTAVQDDGQSVGYQGKPSSSTTKLGLTNKQTPQAITTITRAQMNDFKMNGVKDALRSAPSVTVEQSESDRTEFTSRGFDIGSFEYDGMGMPFAQTIMIGDLDMAEFEQIDVLHGANGLMSGTGNPSATVNFIRKRPTRDFQAQIDTSVGSWDSRRVQADVSGPLTETGNVRGRFIYAHDKGNSWMDRYSHEKNVAAGLLAFDLSDADTFTVGFTQHNSDSNGSTWGNLPLIDANNNPIHYSSRSSNVGQPWTYWNMHTQRAFGEWKHDFGNGWNATLTGTGITEYQDTNMLYVSSVTGDDASAFAAHTTSKAHQLLGEAKVSGPFSLFGRDHELTFGAAYGRTHQKAREYDAFESGYFNTSFAGILAGNSISPQFPFTRDSNTQNFTDRQKSLFAGARFSLAEDLHWIAGARMLSADGTGESYGTDHSQREHGKVTPYTGLVYDLTPQWSVYTSWTEIFNPQYGTVGVDGKVLAPLEGKSLEAGVKGSVMDDRLNLTAAVFKTHQSNVASADYIEVGSQFRYFTEDYESHGVELEASGEALPGLDLLAGYTYVHIENDDGDRARRYVPAHALRGMASYRLPGLPQARIGTRVSWQSGIQNDTYSVIRQNAYALVDLMTSYDIDSNWSTALNFNNITDRKYLTSLYSGTASNYGAPRNLTASLTWRY
jgi:outer membrane receptor for ferric coprogen and ferric-rhodotorulic acid